MAKWRSVTSGISQGPVLGKMLFCTFVVSMDNGTGLTLSKLLFHTKLCGAVYNTGKGCIQRNLDRLEMWDCVNLMKFIKAKSLYSVIN